MPNLAQFFKAEIRRIGRREIKSSVVPIHASNVALKKTVAALKKRIAALEAANKRLLSSQKSTQEQQPAGAPGKARISAKGIRALRSKLGLSQEAFGKLIGVSSQNILIMEHKEGGLRVRRKTLGNILAIRGIGKREAKKRLEEMESHGRKGKR
jgi:DNA-binding transcriptional regulator YiaG